MYDERGRGLAWAATNVPSHHCTAITASGTVGPTSPALRLNAASIRCTQLAKFTVGASNRLQRQACPWRPRGLPQHLAVNTPGGLVPSGASFHLGAIEDVNAFGLGAALEAHARQRP